MDLTCPLSSILSIIDKCYMYLHIYTNIYMVASIVTTITFIASFSVWNHVVFHFRVQFYFNFGLEDCKPICVKAITKINSPVSCYFSIELIMGHQKCNYWSTIIYLEIFKKFSIQYLRELWDFFQFSSLMFLIFLK
jgi:hypothetical protein